MQLSTGVQRMKSKAVVVTGISTGIGASTAEYLAGKSYHVFGSVRRAANGERLQSRLARPSRLSLWM